MHRPSQVMSTPAASSSRSGSEREYSGELSPTCIFPSFTCEYLDGDSSFECCCISPLTSSYLTCRRSPRLLSNGYYIWTESSFLCDKDGNITLSPSQTSVLYKENLVRIFRKKKRIRRSFSSLFALSASESWPHDSIYRDADSSLSEDIWLEGVGKLDTHLCNENNDRQSEKPGAECVKASSPSHIRSAASRAKSHKSHKSPSLHSQPMASEHFQRNLWDHSKTSLLREISFQISLLVACLIISACARWLLGGILSSVCTCSLTITIVFVVKSSFPSLAGYFKDTSCARRSRFAKM